MKEEDRRKRTTDMTAWEEFVSILLALKIKEWEINPKNADGLWKSEKIKKQIFPKSLQKGMWPY